MDVFDPKGNPQKLGNDPIARGGEGEIYALPDMQGVVVKIYHENKLRDYPADFSQKIEKMVMVKEKLEELDVCWPLLSVYDAKKKWIGYGMNQGIGVPMTRFACSVLSQKYFPNLNRVQVVRLLLGLIKTVQKLHAKGVYIGGLQSRKLLV